MGKTLGRAHKKRSLRCLYFGVGLDTVDAVMIGAGAGLSASAGFTYAGERLQRYFSDFRERYGFRDMYTGGFYPYKTSEEYFLEQGVGYNTPGIIKYPFWQMTAENPKETYACINYGKAYCPKEIGERAICIDGDIGDILCRCDNNGKRQIQKICLNS